MTEHEITLTTGHIARHTPKGVGAGGRDAAVTDIAQDLLLRELHQRGALEALVFKGGTALRKLYAGNQGRFSLDLDFSLANVGDDPDTVILDLVGAIDGMRIGPFTYGVAERRGKWSLTVSGPHVSDGSMLSSKLDVSPPVWLDPARRGWVPMRVHETYGSPALPALQVVRLEENIAEKISRLNRVTTARDMYDLAWIADNQRDLSLDTDLIRQLAILKVWVDANGVSGAHARWTPGHEPQPFDSARWLRPRDAQELDVQDIGALAVPVPSAADLSAAVTAHYGFLADLDETQRTLAGAHERDRPLALRALAALPGGRLADGGLR